MSNPLIAKFLGNAGRIPVLRDALMTMQRARHRRDPWMRTHPFDQDYGTKTSGSVPAWLLNSGQEADAHITVYAGCQPSCLRHALSVIPQPERRSFVDFGCGKGRALIVASELPFRRIVGIESAPALVAIARSNARIVRRRNPRRTAIEIVQGDATATPLPDGDLVIFQYHSFGSDVVARMLAAITDAVAQTGREVFLVYENPVHGGLIDAHPQFTRWYCRTVACDPSEIGFAPDDADTIVIWRLGGADRPVAADAQTPIVVTQIGWKAVLATDLAST